MDERLEDADKVITDILGQNEVLCLGFSVMTGQQINSAIRLAKKFHGRIPIVWGGVHPTICPKSVSCKKYADYIIRGDGEEAFLELLHDLDSGNTKADFDYEIHYLNNLNQSIIDFDNEQIAPQYFVERDGFKKAFPLETSRGCPHKCAFCHNSILGHTYRVVDIDLVIKNIEQLYLKYKIDGVIFQEDNFFLKKKRVVEILTRLKKYNIGWKANSRIDYFKKIIYDERFMNLLEGSQCHVLQFGIESGSNRILELINKGLKVEEVVQVNKELAKYNISVRYNFIIGFPTETRNEIEQTLELIDKLHCDNPHMESPFVNIYTPYPGTPLYKLAREEGFTPPTNLKEWSQMVWNFPDATLHSDAEFRRYLSDISNSFLDKSKYPR